MAFLPVIARMTLVLVNVPLLLSRREDKASKGLPYLFFRKDMRTYLAILLLATATCCTERNKAEQTVSSTLSFDQLFYPVDSIQFSIAQIHSPIHWSVDQKKNIFICDYSGPYFIRLRKNEGKLDYIEKEKLGIKNPIASTLDENGNLYISDNSSRRIVTVDTSMKRSSSFVLAGTHITPTALYVKDKVMYMAGFAMKDRNNLHVYSLSGKLLHSLYRSTFTDRHLDEFGGGLNYHYFTIDKGVLYITENLSYTLSALQLPDHTLFTRKYVPDYFTPMPEYTAEEIVTNYEAISQKYSRPRAIQVLGDHVLVQVEMPILNTFKEKGGRFNSMRHRMDVYDRKGRPNHIGIATESKQLIGTDSLDSTLCFLTKYDLDSKMATVVWYKMREI